MSVAQATPPDDFDNEEDPLLDEDPEPEQPAQPPPPRAVPMPAPALQSIPNTGGGTLTFKQNIPPGQNVFPVPNRPAPGAVPPRSTGTAIKIQLENILRDDKKRAERTDWKISVRRLMPFVYKGRRLDTTSVLTEMPLMSPHDVQAGVAAAYGGGKYRAEMLDGSGITQGSWDIDLNEATAGAPKTLGASDAEPGAQMPDEIAKINAETARRKAELELRRLEENMDAEREERKERAMKREEERSQSPQLKALQDLISAQAAAAQRMFETMMKQQEQQQNQFQQLMTTLLTKKDDGGGMKDMAAMMSTMITPMVESMKASRGEQVDIAKANAEAMKETARLQNETMMKVEESKAKFMAEAAAQSKEFMHLIIKDAKPKDTAGELMKYMDLIDGLKDRVDPRGFQEEGGGSWMDKLLPALVPLLARFAQPGTPTGAAVAQFSGAPAGSAPTPEMIDRFAEAIAPAVYNKIVQRAQPQLQQAPQPQLPSTVSALPPVDATTTVPASTQPTPSQQPPTQLDPVAATSPAPSPNPVVDAAAATANAAIPAGSEPMDSEAAERLREHVTDIAQMMLADAKDKRADPTWIADALGVLPAPFLVELAKAPDLGAQVDMFGRHADPIMWKQLLDTLQNMNDPFQKVAYDCFVKGLKAITDETKKRFGV